MAQITLKGNPVHTSGELPIIGTAAHPFTLTATDLSEVSLEDLKGQNVILSIFPSCDTPTCATSVRQFNEKAAACPNTVVCCISADLPFAHKRFCTTENIKNVQPLSTFRHPEFGQNYGCYISDGPIKGLLARAVIVINPAGDITHCELVDEIADEPNYQAALDAIVSLA